MATSQAAPVDPHSMQDVAPTLAENGTPQPEGEEVLSETLYIQNLNEKVKIDGEHRNIPQLGCD